MRIEVHYRENFHAQLNKMKRMAKAKNSTGMGAVDETRDFEPR